MKKAFTIILIIFIFIVGIVIGYEYKTMITPKVIQSNNIKISDKTLLVPEIISNDDIDFTIYNSKTKDIPVIYTNCMLYAFTHGEIDDYVSFFNDYNLNKKDVLAEQMQNIKDKDVEDIKIVKYKRTNISNRHELVTAEVEFYFKNGFSEIQTLQLSWDKTDDKWFITGFQSANLY